MNNKQLLYYQHYLDRCWNAREYYKNETNKLLYWVGTGFVVMLGATGILGARQLNGSDKLAFDLKHIIAFHAVFAIVWFYYLYKQLNADLFENLGKKLESLVRSQENVDVDEKFIGFFSIKGHYLGSECGHGRSLTRFANVFIVGLYICVTGAPMFRGGVSFEALKVNWDFIFSSLVFFVIFFGARKLYDKEKRRVFESLERDWKTFMDSITSKTTPPR